MRKASFSVEKVSSNTDAHNTREHKPKYLIGCEAGCENEYIKYYDYANFQKLAEARYLEVNKQKMQSSQKEALFEEAVISLEKHHTKEDIENLFKSLNLKYTGHTLINLAIHRDEGHFEKDGIEYYPTMHIIQKDDNNWYILDENDTEILEALKDKDFKPKAEDFKIKVNINDFEKVYNYHAHAVFSRFDLKTGKSARFQKSTMSERYKFVAEQMQMNYAPDSKDRFVKKSINQHKGDLSATRNAKLVLKKELEQVHQQEKTILKKENTSLKSQNTKLKNEKGKLKEELQALKDESKDLRAELQLNKAEREAYQQLDYLNKDLQEQLKTGRKSFNEAMKELEVLREKLLKKEDEVAELEEVKKENEYLKSSIEIKEIDILALKSSNKALQEQKELLASKVTDLQEKINSSPNIEDYEAIKEVLELEKEPKKTFFQKVVFKIKEMAQIIKNQAKEIITLQNENYALKISYEAIKSQTNNLSLEDRLELIKIKATRTAESEAPKQQKEKTKDQLDQLVENLEASTGSKSDSSFLKESKTVQEEELKGKIRRDR